MLTDSHCHLMHAQFDPDREEVVDAARVAGVDRILVIADELDVAARAREFVRDRSGLWATAGVHPHQAAQWGPDSAERLAALLNHPEIVAVGEIGLDYHYGFATKQQQLEALERQLDLARAAGLPVVLHNRESDADLLALLRPRAPIAGVLHCFTGDAALLTGALDLGLHISFAGIITFKSGEPLRVLARRVPLDRLLVETDAPYLAPVPMRGRRNQPAFVAHTLAALAEARGEDPGDLTRATTANFTSLFHRI